ncbi:MAG TPA: DUF5668 domain-containing protein [bacterium]|nr:DUF5668 domain-containing protein [bacterium]
MNQQRTRQTSHQWIGILLILVGILFLLTTLDILDLGDLFSDWWPVLIILVGVFKLRERDKMSAVVFIVIGAVLLTATVGILSWSTIGRLWPVLLILAGVSLLWQRYRPARSDLHADTSDTVLVRAIFGGVERHMKSSNFRGGIAEATFGGVELNLRGSTLSSDGAVLDLSAIFGGVELTVPDDWHVVVTGSPILGGIENKVPAPEAETEGPVLRCNCTVIAGGIEIKD